VDEKAAIKAVAATIDSNSAVLLAGLTQAGQARTMEAAHKTVLGTVAAYYTIKLNCRRARHRPMQGVGNINSGRPHETHYEIEVYVADNALMEQNEDDAFINAHESFRVYTDRIVNLFATGTKWLTDADSSKSFRLPPTDERIVTKENLNPMQDIDTSMPILGATIRFVIIGCND
jgi:hypothetical protein